MDFNNSLGQDVGNARASDPEGTYCSECGLTNYFADDVGWFYGNNSKGKYAPLCQKCFNKFGYRTDER